MKETAKVFNIQGRVQGVGYRYFAQRSAAGLGLRGYAKNLADGSVEVYATGTALALDDLAGLLRQGPRWSDVRSVDVAEAEVRAQVGFQIR